MTGKIWYEDPSGFITNETYFIILPTQDMTTEEKINALVRLFIYLGFFLALIKDDYRYIFFGIITCLVSIILYENERAQLSQVEKFLQAKDLDIVNNKVCVRSTLENPFMNPSIADIVDNPTRPGACDLENGKVHDIVDANFNERLFKDVSDLYGKKASQRQFYTMPATTIPNDQSGFASWCYGHAATCKEGAGNQCWNNQYFMRSES
jgi:hypothetical protein